MSVDRCPECHSSTIPGAKFCDHCGFSLSQVKSAASDYGVNIEAVGISCVKCGHQNLAEAKYCEHCGAVILRSPVVSSSPIGQPYFRIAQSDQTIEFPVGKTSFQIGRQDPESEQFPEMDLAEYNAHIFGVGRKHARVTIQSGQVYIEDLDSVNGTMVNQKRILPARPTLLKDGDEVRLGKMIFIFCKG